MFGICIEIKTDKLKKLTMIVRITLKNGVAEVAILICRLGVLDFNDWRMQVFPCFRGFRLQANFYK